MDKKAYNCEVAFSFLDQDEDLATNLFELLSERLDCFIYTQQQKKLAGTDGEKIFNTVFSKESRVVVILHRKEWGNTKWTRIEETAIRNRGFEEGYDFVILIPLDDKPVPPKWLPKNRLWVGLKRWGLESAASVIEARVQERDGIIKSTNVADKIASIENGIKKHREKDLFLDTIEGRQTATDEFKNVVSSIRLIADEIKSKTKDWHLHIRNNKKNGIDLLSYNYQLSIQYYYTHESYMFIALFDGCFNDDGYADDPFNPVKTIDTKRYKFDINKFDQNGWSDLESREDFITTSKLTNYWMEELMNFATQNRLKK